MPKPTEKTVDTIAIRNPLVLEIVGKVRETGAGRRTFTETAENMILADYERRLLDRADAANADASRGCHPELDAVAVPA